MKKRTIKKNLGDPYIQIEGEGVAHDLEHKKTTLFVRGRKIDVKEAFDSEKEKKGLSGYSSKRGVKSNSIGSHCSSLSSKRGVKSNPILSSMRKNLKPKSSKNLGFLIQIEDDKVTDINPNSLYIDEIEEIEDVKPTKKGNRIKKFLNLKGVHKSIKNSKEKKMATTKKAVHKHKTTVKKVSIAKRAVTEATKIVTSAEKTLKSKNPDLKTVASQIKKVKTRVAKAKKSLAGATTKRVTKKRVTKPVKKTA